MKKLRVYPRVHRISIPVTISLRVPATINVNADVFEINMNSAHTILKAIRPPNSMIPRVTKEWPTVAK